MRSARKTNKLRRRVFISLFGTMLAFAAVMSAGYARWNNSALTVSADAPAEKKSISVMAEKNMPYTVGGTSYDEILAQLGDATAKNWMCGTSSGAGVKAYEIPAFWDGMANVFTIYNRSLSAAQQSSDPADSGRYGDCDGGVYSYCGQGAEFSGVHPLDAASDGGFRMTAGIPITITLTNSVRNVSSTVGGIKITDMNGDDAPSLASLSLTSLYIAPGSSGAFTVTPMRSGTGSYLPFNIKFSDDSGKVYNICIDIDSTGSSVRPERALKGLFPEKPAEPAPEPTATTTTTTTTAVTTATTAMTSTAAGTTKTTAADKTTKTTKTTKTSKTSKTTKTTTSAQQTTTKKTTKKTTKPTTAPTTTTPTSAPTTAKPTTAPTTTTPTSAKPTTASTTATPTSSPTSAKPTTASTTATPTSAKPTTASTTATPTSAKPTTASTTATPTSAKPTEGTHPYQPGDIK